MSDCDISTYSLQNTHTITAQCKQRRFLRLSCWIISLCVVNVTFLCWHMCYQSDGNRINYTQTYDSPPQPQNLLCLHRALMMYRSVSLFELPILHSYERTSNMRHASSCHLVFYNNYKSVVWMNPTYLNTLKVLHTWLMLLINKSCKNSFLNILRLLEKFWTISSFNVIFY